MTSRPIGITILTISAIITSIADISIALLAGVGLNQFTSSIISSIPISLGSILADVNAFLGFAASNLVFSIVDLIGNIYFALFAIPIVSIVLAYGFIRGLKWAWFFGMAIYILGLFLFLLGAIYGIDTISIVLIMIYVAIIYYLTRREVRGWFKVKLPKF